MTQEFVDRCVASAADLALFFAGVPENKVMVELYQVRANLEIGLRRDVRPRRRRRDRRSICRCRRRTPTRD